MSILIRLTELRSAASPADLFGREAPLVMEIGVGSGDFLARLANRHPELNVLGVDRAPQSVARTFRRIRALHAGNARLMKADAAFVVRHVVPTGGLRRVYVNYPDPWPRRKHRHRRLLQPGFLRLLGTRLEPGGDVLVTTDHPGYFEFVRQSANESKVFRLDELAPPPEILETKWARKGAACYHAALRPIPKTQEPDPVTNPTELEVASEMYHAVLEGKLPQLDHVDKRTFRGRHGFAVVRDIYRPLDSDGFVFLVHVQEPELAQEVVIEARPGSNGSYVVGLKRFAEPLHTRGVREAVQSVSEWLQQEGMTLIHQKY